MWYYFTTNPLYLQFKSFLPIIIKKEIYKFVLSFFKISFKSFICFSFISVLISYLLLACAFLSSKNLHPDSSIALFILIRQNASFYPCPYPYNFYIVLRQSSFSSQSKSNGIITYYIALPLSQLDFV